ncbi:31157_t:CDS:2, partial [Racocetra persica]
VGKSRLFLRFYDGFFPLSYIITNGGVDYRTKDIVVDDVKIRVDTWDAVNQKHSGIITRVSVILIGNKCDDDKKVVSKEQGQALANEFGIKFLETSARSGINVDEAFNTLVRDIKKVLIDPYQLEQEQITKEQSKASADESTVSNVKKIILHFG